ncbi:MAG: hypothetical protein ACRCXA_05040, partial [Peptostreptococcaceae bacterium]
MKMTKVLMIGSDISVKGGISSVVKQLLGHKWSDDIEIKYIPTHIEGSTVSKIKFFINSINAIIKSIIRENIDLLHIHMSYKGSFYRKYMIFKLGKYFNKRVIIHLHGSEFEC